MLSRSLFAGAVLVALVAACQPPAEAPAMPAALSEQDMATIQAMLDNYGATVTAQDWATYVGYYADDAVRMPPNEPMYQGKDAILASAEALPAVTNLTLTTQLIDGQGNLAYARGTYTFDLGQAEGELMNMVGKWHAIYERQADGSWLCVSDIWNTDAPVPAM
jgi:ketosteroid isomerase-like protein